MFKIVSFYGNKINKENCYVFKDCFGNEYLLNENIHPVKGMTPFIYDKLPFLKAKVKTKKILEKEYIIEIFWKRKKK